MGWKPMLTASTVYSERFRTQEDREAVARCFEDIFGEKLTESHYPDFDITPNCLRIGQLANKRKEFKGSLHSSVFLPQDLRAPSISVLRCLRQGWPCLIIGAGGSGKSEIVRQLASIHGETLVEIGLTPSTDVTELLGCYEQKGDATAAIDAALTSFAPLVTDLCRMLSLADRSDQQTQQGDQLREACAHWTLWWQIQKKAQASVYSRQPNSKQENRQLFARLLQLIDTMLQSIENYGWERLPETDRIVANMKSLKKDIENLDVDNSDSGGRFEWKDGVIVEAMEQGHWLLLDNVNLCPASVLDRLNSVMEFGGQLLLSESGTSSKGSRLIKPKPGFRIFLTMDPRGGEISRAMRNRSVEICLLNHPASIKCRPGIEPHSLQLVNPRDCAAVMVEAGVLDSSIITTLIKGHCQVASLLLKKGRSVLPLRFLIDWASLVQDQSARGVDIGILLRMTFLQVYGSQIFFWMEDHAQFLTLPLETHESKKLNLALLNLGYKHNDFCVENIHRSWLLSQYLLHQFHLRKENENSVESLDLFSLMVSVYEHKQQPKNDVQALLLLEPQHSIMKEAVSVCLQSIPFSDVGVLSQVANELNSNLPNVKEITDGKSIIQCMVHQIEQSASFEHVKDSQEAVINYLKKNCPTADQLRLPLKPSQAIGGAMQLQYSVGESGWDVCKQYLDSLDFLGKVCFERLVILKREAEMLKIIDSYMDQQKKASLKGCSWMQISYAVHKGAVSKAKFTSPVVRLLFPLCSAIDSFIVELFQRNKHKSYFGNICKMLAERDGLWVDIGEFGESRSVQWDQFLVHLRAFRKAVLPILKDTGNTLTSAMKLMQVMDRLQEAVEDQVGAKPFKAVLWKRGGHPDLPSSAEDYQCRNILLQLAKGTQLSGVAFPQSFSDLKVVSLSSLMESEEQGVLCADASLRKEILETMCMFQWTMKRESKKDTHDSNRIRRIPPELMRRLDNQKKAFIEKYGRRSGPENEALEDEEIQALSIQQAATLIAENTEPTQMQFLLTRWADVQISLFSEHWAMSEGLKLLEQLSKVIVALQTDQQKDDLEQFRANLGEYIGSLVEDTFVSCLSAKPFKTLLWAIDAYTQNSMESKELLELLKQNAPEIQLHLNQRIWSSPFNKLGLISESLETPKISSFEKEEVLDVHSPCAEDVKQICLATFGPSRLLQNTRTCLLLRCLQGAFSSGGVQSYSKVSVRNAAVRHLQYQRLSKKVLACKPKHKDLLQFAGGAQQDFLQIIFAFRQQFQSEDFAAITRILLGDISSSIDILIQLLSKCHDERFQLTIEPLQKPIINTLGMCESKVLDLAEQGVLLVHIGLLQLLLLQPSEPIDPGKRPNIKLGILGRRHKEISVACTVARWHSILVTGDHQNAAVQNSVERAAALKTKMEKLRSRVVSRVDGCEPFENLYNDVREFVDSIGSTERVQSICKSLVSKADSAVREESMWQSASSAFLGKLKRLYSDYDDIIPGISNAVYKIKNGMRLLATSAMSSKVNKKKNTVPISIFLSPKRPLHQIQDYLLAFPLMGRHNLEIDMKLVEEGVNNVLIMKGSKGVHAAANILLATLLRLELGLVSGSYSWKDVKLQASILFARLWRAWRKMKDDQDRKAAEQAELVKYKTQTHEAEDEEEKQEKSFRELFPDFSKNYSSLFEDDESIQMDDKPPIEEDKDIEELDSMLGHLSETQLQCLVGVYTRLLLSYNSTKESLHRAKRWHAFEYCYRASSSLVEESEFLLSPEMDRHSMPAHLLAASHGIQLCRGKSLLPGTDQRAPESPKVKKERGKKVKQKVALCSNTESTGNLIAALHGMNDPQTVARDFHRDGWPSETKRADAPLAGLLGRAADLLVQFPGNHVLLQLAKVADHVRRLDLLAPLGQVLCGLEVVLRKAQEWEQYTSKQYSLAEQLMPLSRLVARWRRLELEWWGDLLKCREQRMLKQAQRWWLHLYGLLNQSEDAVIIPAKEGGPIPGWPSTSSQPQWLLESMSRILGLQAEETEKEATAQEIPQIQRDVFGAMDDFLRTSTIGEFGMRLHLVQVFSIELIQTDSKQKQDLGRTLRGLWLYYNQYVSAIEDARLAGKAPIEKKLKEEVKLGKWDEQRYYMLAEATEKSHRRLAKHLKDYDDILQSSVSLIFDKLYFEGGLGGGGQTACTEVPALSFIFSSVQTFEAPNQLQVKSEDENLVNEVAKRHFKLPKGQKVIGQPKDLMQLYRTLGSEEELGYASKTEALERRMAKLLHESIFDASKSNTTLLGAEICEELCEAIFSRINSLRAEGIARPVKKRAVLDLLKGLKQQGLSFSASTSPSQLKDIMQVFSLPDTFQNTPNPPEAWQKARNYFFKDIAEISRLRLEAQQSHSPDVSRAEVQAMVGLAESLFSIAAHQRGAISAFEDDLKRFQQERKHLAESFRLLKTAAGEGNASLEAVMSLSPAQESLLDKLHSQDQGLAHVLEALVQIVFLGESLECSSLDEDQCKVWHTHLEILQKVMTNLKEFQSKLSNSLVRSKTSYSEELDSTILHLKEVQLYAKSTSVFQQASAQLAALTRHPLLLPYSAYEKVFQRLEALTSEASKFTSSSLKPWLEVQNSRRCKGLGKEVIGKRLSTFLTKLNAATESLMITVQSLCKSRQVEAEDDSAENNTSLLSLHGISLLELKKMKLWQAAKALHEVREELIGLAQSFPQNPGSVAILHAAYGTLHPLAAQVEGAVNRVMNELLHFHKGLVKLEYVVIRVFRTLLAKGLCSAETKEEEGEGDGKGQFEDDVEGTGMGEGKGAKDVSDQIEDEEQILGLKGEEKQNDESQDQDKKLDEEDEDKGLEMSNDFDGEMFDVDNKEDEDQKDEDEENEEEELDREMGDTGDQDDIVDERMWGSDDEEEENQDKDEKFEENSNVKGEQLEDEIRGKEDEENPEGDKEDGKPQAEDKGEQKEQGADQQQDDGHEEFPEDEGPVNDDLEENYEEPGAGMDVRENEPEEESDTELPENMQLDGDDDQSDDGANAAEMEVEKVENEVEEEDDQKDQEREEEEGNVPADEDEGNNQEELPEEDQAELGGAGESGQFQEEEEEEDKKEEGADPLDDNGQDASKNQEDPAYGIESEAGKQDDSVLENPEPINATEESTSEANEKENKSSGAQDDQNDTGQTGQGEEADDTTGGAYSHVPAVDAGREESKRRTQREKESPNPFRQPGDAMRHWHERLDLLRRENEASEENQKENEDAETVQDGQDKGEDDSSAAEGKFEFANKGEDSTSQVLGGVTDENQVSLPTTQQDDKEAMDGNKDTEEDTALPADVEMQEEIPEKELPSSELERLENSGKNVKESKQQDTERRDSSNEQDSTMMDESKEMEEDRKSEEGEEEIASEQQFGAKLYTSEKHQPEIEDDAMEEEKPQSLGEQLQDLHLTERLAPDASRMEVARDQWRSLRQLTAPLSQRLCEQLRLVLEPLVATKLQGDYRTGKRINMKRVISYIASGFRKDRIWMRRTKPAQRNYQVLLAIDDSESMMDLHAGPLSLAALATVASGLVQLEVGQLAIAKFGKEVNLLHNFTDQFTEDSGASVISSFTFAQPRTHTADTLERIFSILNEAQGQQRGSTVSMQLVFLISDGRFDRDNKGRLRKIIRDMNEKNQLLVLIIIDKEGDSSILNTQEAIYHNGKLQISRYLDNYPFMYYIVLQDIDALPEILTDALRQWFELIQHESANS